MLDQVPASLFVKDREGRYRLINQACERLLGIPRERILGKTAQEVLPPELANQFLANDLQVLATEAPHRFEVIIPQADGLHTFESLQFPLRDAQGDCHAFCGISIDITARKHAEQEARQTTAQRLGALIEQGLAGVVEVDLAGRILRCNQRYCEIVGHDQEALLGGCLPDITFPEDWLREQALFERLVRGQGSALLEKRYLRRDGGISHTLIALTLLRDADGQPEGFLSLVTDINKRKEVEEQLRQSEERARRQLAEIQTYYDTAPIGLCVLDRDLRFLRVNDRLAVIDGLSVAAHLGRTFREVLPTLADIVEPLLQRVLATGEPLLNREISGETPAQPGVTRVWRGNFPPLRDDAGQVSGINIMVEEITALKQAERQLRESEKRYRELSAALELKVQERTLELRNANAELNRLATTDGLTGIWNRRHLEQAVAREMARARRYGEPLALVMFDIDHFKSINDRHGHLVGDRILIELAERVRHQLRASDVLARWGGEEFAILMPHCSARAATGLAEKLRLALMSQPFPTAGTITTSFGVAEYQPPETLDDWFTRADNALYDAKEAGRNRVVIAA